MGILPVVSRAVLTPFCCALPASSCR